MLGADCINANPVSPNYILGCNWPEPGSEEIDLIEVQGSAVLQLLQQSDLRGWEFIPRLRSEP